MLNKDFFAYAITAITIAFLTITALAFMGCSAPDVASETPVQVKSTQDNSPKAHYQRAVKQINQTHSDKHEEIMTVYAYRLAQLVRNSTPYVKVIRERNAHLSTIKRERATALETEWKKYRDAQLKWLKSD